MSEKLLAAAVLKIYAFFKVIPVVVPPYLIQLAARTRIPVTFHGLFLPQIRRAAAIQAIGNIAEHYQVPFFTCHTEQAEESHEKAGAKNLQVTE